MELCPVGTHANWQYIQHDLGQYLRDQHKPFANEFHHFVGKLQAISGPGIDGSGWYRYSRKDEELLMATRSSSAEGVVRSDLVALLAS